MNDPIYRALREVLGITEVLTRLSRLETDMASAAEQITELGNKVEGVGAVLADVAADFAAFRQAMEAERENLTEAGQAALNEATAKAEVAAQRASDLDVAIGDADGSDLPTEPTDPTEPAA